MKKVLVSILIIIFTQTGLPALADGQYYLVDYPDISGNGTRQVIVKRNKFKRDHFAKPSRCCARKRVPRSNTEQHRRTDYRLKLRQAYHRAKVVDMQPKPKLSVSRLDKNYNVMMKKQAISCNGVTYYGTINACK